jgi:hypothetical protein
MVSKGRISTTVNEIRERVSDATLVWYYLGVRQIPCFIQSPIRKDDRPSFGLYSLDGKKIYFTDLATKERGGIYDLLSKMWHCSLDETLARINKDLCSNTGNVEVHGMPMPKTVSEMTRSNISMQVKIREWRKYDIDYWASYGISLDWLNYAEVYPISHKIMVKNGVKSIFTADKLAYVFVEHKEGKTTLKVYQPLTENKRYKWANTHDRSVISLWTKIPETGERVVICSSLKDALCLWANTGIPSLALQGEGYGISNTAMSELKRRYKNVYILFDNDKAGIEDAIKLAEHTGFTNIVLPTFVGGKDVSDMFKCMGKEYLKETVKKLFTNH